MSWFANWMLVTQWYSVMVRSLITFSTAQNKGRKPTKLGSSECKAQCTSHYPNANRRLKGQRSSSYSFSSPKTIRPLIEQITHNHNNNNTYPLLAGKNLFSTVSHRVQDRTSQRSLCSRWWWRCTAGSGWASFSRPAEALHSTVG